MIFSDPYFLSSAVIVAAALVDRFLVKRNSIKLHDVTQCKDNQDKFVLRFETKKQLKNTRLTYTIRDKKHPTTVIAGKSRTLDFSRLGMNEEYISFDGYKFPPNTDWIIDVQICNASGCYINPLYKIFPLITKHRNEVHFV